jgi:hypothetical protein
LPRLTGLGVKWSGMTLCGNRIKLPVFACLVKVLIDWIPFSRYRFGRRLKNSSHVFPRLLLEFLDTA